MKSVIPRVSCSTTSRSCHHIRNVGSKRAEVWLRVAFILECQSSAQGLHTLTYFDSEWRMTLHKTHWVQTNWPNLHGLLLLARSDYPFFRGPYFNVPIYLPVTKRPIFSDEQSVWSSKATWISRDRNKLPLFRIKASRARHSKQTRNHGLIQNVSLQDHKDTLSIETRPWKPRPLAKLPRTPCKRFIRMLTGMTLQHQSCPCGSSARAFS